MRKAMVDSGQAVSLQTSPPSEGSGVIQGTRRLILLSLLFLLFGGSSPAATPVRLLGSRIELQRDGSTLVVFSFDRQVHAVLLKGEGRRIEILVKGLESSTGLSLGGDVIGYSLVNETLTDLFNSHTHAYQNGVPSEGWAAPPAPQTNVPDQQMDDSHLTEETIAS